MSAAVAGQQAGAWTDVGAGQFKVAAALAGLLTDLAAINVAVVAMPLDFRLRDIGDDVLFDRSGGFEVVAPAVAALVRMDVVLDEHRIGGRFRPKASRMLAALLTAPICGFGFFIGPSKTT